MEYSKAFKIAEKYLNMLKPYCDRIELGGSLARQCSEVKDIEIICIPKKIYVKKGLFEVSTEPCREFVNIVNSLKKIKGDPYGKYTARELPEGINLDLFIAEFHNWGYIKAIRTGPASFSKGLLSHGKKNGLRFDGGVVYGSTGCARVVPTEEDFFQMCGVKYIEPQYRVSI